MARKILTDYPTKTTFYCTESEMERIRKLAHEYGFNGNVSAMIRHACFVSLKKEKRPPRGKD